jgi:hypothetical protein
MNTATLQRCNFAVKYKVQYDLIYFLKRRDLACKISKLSNVCVGVCMCVSRCVYVCVYECVCLCVGGCVCLGVFMGVCV